MYNNFLYWTHPYGVNIISSDNGWSFAFNTLYFNGYNFSDLIISNIPDSYDGDNFDISTYSLTTHGEGLGKRLIKNRTLTVTWYLIAENQEELEKKIISLKGNILCWESVLYLKRKFGKIKTKAVVSSLSIPRKYRTVNAVEVQIVFKILDPFFYWLKLNEVSYQNINSEFNTLVSYTSWSHASRVALLILFSSATVSKVAVSIGEKTLYVNESITDGDTLVIDGERLDVALNWVYGCDWDWEFGELAIWETAININFEWEFLAEIFIQYKDTYV